MYLMKTDMAKYEGSVRALGPFGIAFSSHLVPEPGDTKANFEGKLAALDDTMSETYDFLKAAHKGNKALEDSDWRNKKVTQEMLDKALATIQQSD
jgi:hypothetical protein